MPTDSLLPLLSKQGLTVIRLANLLLAHQPGDRIAPIQQYAEQFEIGVGTVQAAIAYLQEVGAVELESRGHLGTFIRTLNYPLLWSLTGQDYLVGGMPLPYSRRYEGLATALYESFRRSGVALNLVYTRGSWNRLRALTGGKADFVVLSRFAFKNALEHGLEIEEVLNLGSESYVGEHAILLRDHSRTQIEDGMRVGVDSSSIDQILLAREACQGRQVEFVQLSYMNLMAALEKGQIDATVWNRDDFNAPASHFKVTPLRMASLAQSKENTEAVIAVRKGNTLVLQMLRSIIDRDAVRDIQRRVMDGTLSPTY